MDYNLNGGVGDAQEEKGQSASGKTEMGIDGPSIPGLPGAVWPTAPSPCVSKCLPRLSPSAVSSPLLQAQTSIPPSSPRPRHSSLPSPYRFKHQSSSATTRQKNIPDSRSSVRASSQTPFPLEIVAQSAYLREAISLSALLLTHPTLTHFQYKTNPYIGPFLTTSNLLNTIFYSSFLQHRKCTQSHPVYYTPTSFQNWRDLETFSESFYFSILNQFLVSYIYPLNKRTEWIASSEHAQKQNLIRMLDGFDELFLKIDALLLSMPCPDDMLANGRITDHQELGYENRLRKSLLRLCNAVRKVQEEQAAGEGREKWGYVALWVCCVERVKVAATLVCFLEVLGEQMGYFGANTRVEKKTPRWWRLRETFLSKERLTDGSDKDTVKQLETSSKDWQNCDAGRGKTIHQHQDQLTITKEAILEQLKAELLSDGNLEVPSSLELGVWKSGSLRMDNYLFGKGVNEEREALIEGVCGGDWLTEDGDYDL